MSDTITIRIKKPGMIWLAVIVSLLLHLLLIIAYFPDLLPPEASTIAQGPMQVTLAPNPNSIKEGNKAKEKSELAKAALPKSKPQVKPTPKKAKPKKTKRKQKATPAKPSKLKPKETKANVLAVQRQETERPEFIIPEKAVNPPSEQTVTTVVVPSSMPSPPVTREAPTDMMSLIKQRRQERAARGDPSAINALEEGKLNGQSVKKNVDDIIQQNLRQPGTNGIFTVTTLNRFEGTFSFQGWKGEFSNAQRRFYRVDTFSTSEDIRVLMVSKMIDIIRTHYAGDFQWQSRRLGETVTLSARPKDHTQLVRFLLTEFQLQFDQFLHYR